MSELIGHLVTTSQQFMIKHTFHWPSCNQSNSHMRICVRVCVCLCVRLRECVHECVPACVGSIVGESRGIICLWVCSPPYSRVETSLFAVQHLFHTFLIRITLCVL